MNKPYNIFISWSGVRSEYVATFLHEWLQILLQDARPWISKENIGKGTRSLDQMRLALMDIRVGITCLTPENLSSPWILYEAGALTKSVDSETRLCTYLLGGLKPNDVPQPLGMFQHSQWNREDTQKLVHTINATLESPVQATRLDALFERFWPDLERHLQNLPEDAASVAPKRPLEDMVAEILELTRAITNGPALRRGPGRLPLPNEPGEAG